MCQAHQEERLASGIVKYVAHVLEAVQDLALLNFVQSMAAAEPNVVR